MTRKYKPKDFSQLTTYSAAQRAHKAVVESQAALPQPGASATDLLDSWPAYLGAQQFRLLAEAIADATKADRPVVAAFGAHVIKVGCAPILIDLIERGMIKAIACNGACAIHDAELATMGQTSEEVADTINDGRFGMVRETLTLFDRIIKRASHDGRGLGRAVGDELIESNAPHGSQSVFVAAAKADIPACVQVALGTDTVHVSSGMDGASLGDASMYDFRLLCDVVSDLGAVEDSGVGGVWLNIGSAVILPEVFLKAVSVARNLGANLDAMTTANMDMMRHYRTRQNVLTRPVQPGRGFEIIGHHEIMLPLLRQAVIEKLEHVTPKRNVSSSMD